MTEVVARLDGSPMTWRRWIAIGLVPLLMILDGLDAASISFAAPEIAKDWKVKPDTLGWLLSMELVGMAIGSVLLGALADRIGRRPTLIACLATITLGMALASRAGSVDAMLAFRLLTGLGIGGLLAAATALIGEYSRQRDRAFAISIMTMGFPLGGMIGGWFAAELLTRYEWTVIFELGALVTGLVLPIVWLFMPESPEWLERRNPANALARINASLGALGIEPVGQLPVREQGRGDGIAEILRKPLLFTTVLLTLAYVFHVGAFYFLAKWLPKLAVESGLTSSEGALVLSRYMMGSACGGLVLALLSKRFAARHVIMVALVLFALTMLAYGNSPVDFGKSLPLMMLFGVLANLPAAGVYVLLAGAYPPHLRASGVGFGVGAGRVGASLGPVLAGILFAEGSSIQTVAMVMALSSLLAALAIKSMAVKDRT